MFGATASSGSVFGGGAATTPTASTGNIFGSAGAASPTSSIFGGANANANAGQLPTSSVFGGTSSSGSGGFGFGQNNQSPFGQSNQNTSNAFGGQANQNNSASGGSIFASVAPTSPFGGTAQNQQSSASVFGGGGSNGGFGSFSQQASQPAFGSPPAFGTNQSNAGGFTSGFSQGGLSISQAGFGSPTNATGFGSSGSPVASQQPNFGQSPAFGGAASFGSPKTGFGTFSGMNINPNPSFGAPQKNTLFESLGSSENAMTFGNLAQNQNQANMQPKPFSGR